MSTKRKKHIMGWSTQAQVVLTVQSQGRVLQVACTPVPGTTMWSLVALEIRKPKDGDILNDPKKALEALDGVLDTHRHESLQMAEGLEDAMEVAEAYAAKWQRKEKSAETCECTDIELEASSTATGE